MGHYLFSSKEVDELLENYNDHPNLFPSQKLENVHIWDETLRDGEQSPGVFLTTDEKIEIAKMMDEIGIKMAAVGFPAVSSGERDSVSAIVHEGFSNLKILGIARPRESDINECLACELTDIVIFLPISDLAMKIYNLTPEGELKQMEKAIQYAQDHGLRVNWVSEDSSRASPEHLHNVFQKAVDLDVERIVLSDTVGTLFPQTTAHLVNQIFDKIKLNGCEVGFHGHNDFGLATSNTVNAVLHGVTYPHTCINGYGERAGNAAFEEVVLNLERLNIETGIKLEKIFELSQLTERCFGLPIAPNKAVIGNNAFSHESGLHINAILAHPQSYEPINPKSVGRQRQYYIGKFSGSGAIVNALKTKLNIFNFDPPQHLIRDVVEEIKRSCDTSDKQEHNEIFNQIKTLIGQITAGVTDKEFYEIVRKILGKYAKEDWSRVIEEKMKEKDHGPPKNAD